MSISSAGAGTSTHPRPQRETSAAQSSSEARGRTCATASPIPALATWSSPFDDRSDPLQPKEYVRLVEKKPAVGTRSGPEKWQPDRPLRAFSLSAQGPGRFAPGGPHRDPGCRAGSFGRGPWSSWFADAGRAHPFFEEVSFIFCRDSGSPPPGGSPLLPESVASFFPFFSHPLSTFTLIPSKLL